ncbi:hypothetical protein [Hansschlegelia beijingensis]|uniref:Uncharacterized protein n=1 Tax=Hansschlegelia beijingensis TaxID=1133344 RepID=A0A7W6GGE9_9HYPH|nr:hypothetical protein [Hansschlegelia beijingensis]MBB3973952.1 hypothetical protein [Hansschlegelia beijingensis]
MSDDFTARSGSENRERDPAEGDRRKPGAGAADRGATPESDGRPVEKPAGAGDKPKAENWRGEPDDQAGPGQ